MRATAIFCFATLAVGCTDSGEFTPRERRAFGTFTTPGDRSGGDPLPSDSMTGDAMAGDSGTCWGGDCGVPAGCLLNMAEITDACGNDRFCLPWTFSCTGNELTCTYVARSCDDQDPCTDDWCNENLVECRHDAVAPPFAEGAYGGYACDNGADDDCDGWTDIEDPGCGGCGEDAHCDDANPCTDDACVANACQNQPVAGTPSCSDGDACTVNDVCRNGVCSGDPPDIDGDGAIASSCGGNDCNDNSTVANPTRPESTAVSGLCTDGFDNDCDGRIDDDDPSCHPSFCSPSGICWLHPAPHGVGLWGTWAVAANDIWVVGDYGLIMRWDGSWFTPYDSGTDVRLYAVWAADANNAWAVGESGTITHYNGSTWSASTQGSEDLRAIRGRGTTDIWAVGDAGTMLSSADGTTWTTFTGPSGTPDLRAVELDSTGHIWVGAGSVYQWDTTQWIQHAPGNTTQALWRVADDDLWASGGGDIVAHWNGSVWTPYDTAVFSTPTYWGLWATSTSNVWIGGQGFMSEGNFYQWNGASWLTRGSFEPIARAVTGAGTGPVWAYGDGGLIVNHDGVSASRTITQQSTEWGLAGIHAFSKDDVWVPGGYNVVMRWHGGYWRLMYGTSESSSQTLRGAFALSETEAWIVGGQGTSGTPARVLFWNGREMTEVHQSTTARFNDVWASAADDVWVSYDGGVLHWDGVEWISAHTNARDMWGIWGFSASDVWAVGEQTISHWDGTNWTDTTAPGSADLQEVWGASTGDIWAVGGTSSCPSTSATGVILRRTATTWDTIRDDIPCATGVSGLGTDVYVSAGSDLYHFDGSTWTPLTGLGPTISDVSVAPTGEVYIVGAGNMVGVLP